MAAKKRIASLRGHTETVMAASFSPDGQTLATGGDIEALAKLPAMIRQLPSDEELETRVLEVLLDGVLLADAAAVVNMNTSSPSEPLTCAGGWGAAGEWLISSRAVASFSRPFANGACQSCTVGIAAARRRAILRPAPKWIGRSVRNPGGRQLHR